MKSDRNQFGFTLVELIITMMIGVLIFAIVSSIFVLNQNIYRKSINKAELVQNARVNLDLMSREIRQAKNIVTDLPADNTDPELVSHELQFEDGHDTEQIQYIKYLLNGDQLIRQVIIYYFDTDHNTHVYCNDVDSFGPPESEIQEEKLIGENYSIIDFYGSDVIQIDLTLEKNNESVKISSLINPRNN